MFLNFHLKIFGVEFLLLIRLRSENVAHTIIKDFIPWPCSWLNFLRVPRMYEEKRVLPTRGMLGSTKLFLIEFVAYVILLSVLLLLMGVP